MIALLDSDEVLFVLHERIYYFRLEVGTAAFQEDGLAFFVRECVFVLIRLVRAVQLDVRAVDDGPVAWHCHACAGRGHEYAAFAVLFHCDDTVRERAAAGGFSDVGSNRKSINR